MTKCFLDDEIDQSLMMPPSLHDWLPEDHLARFVADLVPSLDLSEFYASYAEKDGRGQAAYHPVMMVRLLIYGYGIGVVSSRQIEKRTMPPRMKRKGKGKSTNCRKSWRGGKVG